MAGLRRNGVRVVRKTAHLSHRVLRKGSDFAAKVEDKTTRIITGKDYSFQLESTFPVEKVLFNGIKYNLSPLNPALPAVGREGKVTLLIPSLNKQSFFGGTATAIIIAAKLAEKVHRPLRIIETLKPGGKDGLGSFLEDNGVHLSDEVELIDVSARTYNRYGYIDLHPDDILIASAWWDARLLSQLPLKKPFIYLIQDYEPIFYPNSDEYLLAESTYRTDNFIPLCNTELMYKFMSAKGYTYIKNNGLWFEPAVSKKQLGLSSKGSGKKRMFLYGRPLVPRNLFHSALLALNKCFDNGDLDPNGWDIFMAGQDKLVGITLSTGVQIHNLGKLSMDEYGKFMCTIDLAVSPMMAPHPNYPTLEFASVGAAVVSTKYETKQSLAMYSKNIFLSELNIDDLAKTIVQASKLSAKKRQANLKHNSIESSWDNSLREVLGKITQRLS